MFILCLFEQCSGLKINFTRARFSVLVRLETIRKCFEEIFTCKRGELPFRYLGLPIDRERLRNKDWKKTEDKFEKKLSCWQGRLLTSGGRLVLINSCLSNTPLYMFFF